MASPNKAEIKAYYEDNGWKATISKYRIAPKDLSVLLGKKKAAKKNPAKKSKAKKSTKKKPGRPKKSESVKKAPKKSPKKAPKKSTKKKPVKKVAKNAAKKKGKGGRRPNPDKLISQINDNLERLRGLIAA